MDKTFQLGIEMGKAHYAKIVDKGDRWKSRFIPVYIRQSLMIPYYITDVNGSQTLFIIQYPVNANEKVLFITYATKPPD